MSQLPTAPLRRAGLRLRLGLLVLAAIGGFALMAIWYTQSQISASYEESARSELTAMATAIDASFEAYNLDRPSVLLARIELLAANSDALREAAIYTRREGVPERLVTTDPASIGRPIDPRHLSVFESGRPNYWRERALGHDVAVLIAPLHGAGPRPAALLALVLDYAPRHAELGRRVRNLALAAASVAVVIVGLVLAMLGRAVVRPLRTMTEATGRIAAGHLGTRLRLRRADEIGDLGDAFDNMAEALEATRLSVEQGNAKLHRARAEQERLRRVAEAVAAEEEPAAVLALVAEEAAALLGTDAGAVTRFDDGRMRVVSSWTRPGSPVMSVDPAGATAAVRETGRSATQVTASTGPRRTTVAAPVRVGGRLWGAVGGASLSDAAIPPGAENLLERFAGLVGLAIANASARARLREEASTDALTGLANHRAFQEALAQEIGRARRHGRPLSLVVLDLDHFKQVNDEHGHQRGDEVLREAARRLGANVRDIDTLARVGGEEFAWLMPETSGMEAWQAAERARAAICADPFPGVGRVTISAGICDMVHAYDGGELYRLADGALYWSKNHGRDVVFLYSPDVVRVLSDAEQAGHLARRQAMQSIRALSRAVDARDPSTREHSERVADVAAALASALGWDAERCASLHEAGLVHDVGKIAVPEAILSKPGRLTPDETEIVRTHAAIGAGMLGDVLTDEQVAWVRGHHESWDGGGYPDGLAREQVPEGARILALADAWDVMRSARVYKQPLDLHDAVEEVRRSTGTQFWPPAVDALERLVAADALPAAHEVPGGRPR